MTTLVPKFALPQAHPEIVFIADQSGSMGGTKNVALVAALKVFLKSLPLGVRFNICAFGSHFEFLWPKSQAYNENNVNTAIAFVDSFVARYGGTEILNPITAAFEQRLSDLPLEVMLLTDGEIWGEDAVFRYINGQIRDKGADARVFALGIGGDVSHTLVEGVARAGNGFAQFVTQNEDIDQKVVRMLKGALYAHTKAYELEVHYGEMREAEEMSDGDDEFEIVEKVNDCLTITDEAAGATEKKQSGGDGKTTSFFDNSADLDKPMKTEGETADRYAHLPSIETPKLLQAPNTIPPLFPFNRTTVYLLLSPDSAQKKVASVTLRATSDHGPLELDIPVNYSSTSDIPTIHQLAARKAVQNLEEGRGWIQAAKTTDGVSVKTKYESRVDELVEREGVRLGEKFQVASKWTSFVAVEDKTNQEMDVGGEEVDQNQIIKSAIASGHGYAMQRTMPMGIASQGMRMGAMQRRSRRLAGSSTSTSRYVDSAPFDSAKPTQQNPFGRTQNSTLQAGAGTFFGGFGSNSQSKSGAGGIFGCATPNTRSTSGAIQTPTANTSLIPGSIFGPIPPTSRSQSGGLFGGGGQTSTSSGGLFGSTFKPFPEVSGTATTSPPTIMQPAPPGFGRHVFSSDSVPASFRPPLLTSPHSSDRYTPPVTKGTSSFSPASPAGTADDAECAEELEASDDDEDMGYGLFDSDSAAGIDRLGAAVPQSTGSKAREQVYSRGPNKLHSGLYRMSVPLPLSNATTKSDGKQVNVGKTHALINLQTFSGAWTWNAEFFATLGVDPNTVSKEAIGSTDPETCATALAIAFLEGKAGDKKDVWEMVVAKARAWLGTQLDVGEKGVSEVVAEAGAFLK